MPDKVTPQQFSEQIKAKYPQYKDISDIELARSIVDKYPDYKDYVDFGPTAQVQPVQQAVQPQPSKYQKAVQDDRSELGKTLSSWWNGIVTGTIGETVKSVFDLAASYPTVPTSFGAPPSEEQVRAVQKFKEAPLKERLEISQKAFAPVEKGIKKIRSKYTTEEEDKAIAGEFNLFDGVGLNDLKGLAAMSGRMATDMALGALTGGTTFVLQGRQMAVDDYDEAVKKAGLEPNENARNLYGIAGGTINGLLEKFAIDKIFGDTPVFRDIQRKAIAETLKKTAGMTGKAAIDAIEANAIATVKQLTSDLKSKGVRALYRGSIEGGTESLQAGLEDAAKFAANAVQGDEAFNREEIKKNFLKNIVNSGVAGGIFGPVFGAGADVAFGRNINTELLNDIANAKTPEDIENIRLELNKTFDDNNFSQEERDIIMQNANRYAQVKQTLPDGTPAELQKLAIPKIEQRVKIDNEIANKKAAAESLDESVKSAQQQDISLLEDKRASLNDEVREILTGDKFNYIEENGKYFKQLGENPREEISKNRYDLEQIKTEGYATTEGQEPIQEGRAEGDISQRQRTQEEGAQGTTTKTDSRYRNISSEKAVGIPALLGARVEYRLPGKKFKDGRRSPYRKITGTLIQEGQTLSVQDEKGKIVAEIGNVDELSNVSPEERNITVVESKVETTDKGFKVDGNEFLNENENPFDAVSVDQNGNVMNVVLTTPTGKRRKFRGRVAEDLAKQISEKEDARIAEEDRQLQQRMALPTAEAPIVITTEPAIAKVTEENLEQVDTIDGTPLQKKVLADVKPVVRAIAAAVRNITGAPVSVNIHNQDTFGKAVQEAGGTEQEAASRGFYMASDGSIHLNVDNIDSDTMLHEGFHPILDALEKFNPQVIDELFAQLEGIAEAAPIIQAARDNYEGDITQKKEAITDFVAGVADGRIVLNPSNFQKIKNFILDMLNRIGLGQGSKQLMTVNNEQDLIKLANFITEKFKTGEIITLDTLTSLLGGDMQYDTSTGLDIEVDMPDTGSGVKPQFSKDTLEAARNNTKSINDLKGTKISRVVFYDITRVGKLEIKNIKTGYTPDVDGKGGPLWSYMNSSLKNKSVLAFVSLNQAIQSLQRQMMYPDAAISIASQNPLTAHLGNKSTLKALFGQGVGIFQNAANTKAKEKEILGALISEVDRISKTPAVKEANKSVNKILKTVNLKDIKTIDEFRDKILLGEGDSFGSRGSILAEILQNKQSKVTAATRDSHKILHYKYGIPTIADIAQGNNQPELSNVELGDVMKFVKPSTEPVIYTTDRNAYDTYSKKPTPEMKKSGIRIELLPEQDAHESYPFVLVGENVALLDEYVSAAQLFERFKGIKKSQTFFKIGRMKKYAEAGMVQEKVPTEKKGPQFQKAPKTVTKKPTGTEAFIKEQFRFGLLGKEVMKFKEKMSGELSAEIATAEKLVKKAQEAIKTYGTSLNREDILNFMTGQPTSTPLPTDVADALSDMRGHIDGLTERLIQLGVIEDPETIEYYRQNKGEYLVRSYEAVNYRDNFLQRLGNKGLNVDNVSKKLKNVDKTVVDAALNFLARRAMAENSALTMEQAMKQARKEANDILSDAETYVFGKTLTGSTNVKSLSQRKDISPEIRALMGEYTDPLYNYYASIFKIASLTSSRQYLNSLKEFGMGKFLFTKEGRPEDANTMVAAEGTETLSPLNGLYTFQPVAEALQKVEKEKTNVLLQAMGRIRKFKTVYNPATHVKNIIGNMGFVVSNGHWNYLPESYKYIRALVTGKDDAEIRRVMDTLNRYSVLNNAVGVNELKSYFDRHDNVDDFLQNIYDNGKKKSVASSVANAAGSVGKAMEKAYAIEDDVFKILAFVNESNRYAKATYNKKYSELTDSEKADINDTVAEIVKNTYPTFSRVPKFVRGLSKVAFLGNFLSFPAESIRVQYNSLKLALDEYNSGNPKLKTIGLTRMAGALAYNSLFSTLVYYSYGLAGAGLTGMLGYFGNDDDEENRKRSSIQKFLAPWNKAKDVFVSKFKDGKLVYYDIGSLDSYSYQKSIWNEFWSNMNNEKGFNESISKAVAKGLDPWLEVDFAVKNMQALLTNDDGRGGRVWNPEDTPEEIRKKQAMFVGKQFGPGAAGAMIRIADAYQKGESDKVKDELVSQVFARKYSVDLKKQFQNYIYVDGTPKMEVGFRNRLDNAEKIYRDAKRQGLKGQELEARYQDAIRAYKNILKTANEYYSAAVDGGVKSNELRRIVGRARLGRSAEMAIINGYMPDIDRLYIRK
jgi:hypothetical protein